ncbi:MAG: T9SS type A sorting domain-containing protein [Flavobacteriales bacterium]|nr:T9SS type A sorting domain-containing protein [Flavobacteriales bacterium]
MEHEPLQTDEVVLYIVEDDEELAEETPLSVEEIEEEVVIKQENNFKVYPNPTTGHVRVEVNTAVESLMITSITGERIGSISMIGKTTEQFDLSNYPTGAYFFSFVNEGNMTTKKVIVVR